MNIYHEAFPRGSTVRIASRSDLEVFQKTWKDHHPIEPDQLSFAGQPVEVKAIGFYHGGDVLYQLVGIPGTRHERCLEAVG